MLRTTLLFILLGICFYTKAQKKDSLFISKPDPNDTALIAHPYSSPTFIVIDKVKFRTDAKTWFTLGPALDRNKLGYTEGNLGIAVQHLYKKFYVQLGAMRAKEFRDRSFFPSDYASDYIELHTGIGLKAESKYFFLAAFMGPSVSKVTYIEPESGKLTKYVNPGLHTDVQLVYKPLYDVGCGLDFFADLSLKYPIGGVRLTLMLSDAYMKTRR